MEKKHFDSYYSWLGIPPSEQPPDHYRLLCIDTFESKYNVIKRAWKRQSDLVRPHQQGPHAADADRILAALNAAQECLGDADRKARYDQQLRSTSTSSNAGSTTTLNSNAASERAEESQNQSPSDSPFEVKSSSNSMRNRTGLRGKQSSSLRSLLSIVLGGVAGVLIGVLVLKFGFNVDPFGFWSKTPSPSEKQTPASNPRSHLAQGHHSNLDRPPAQRTPVGSPNSQSMDTFSTLPTREKPTASSANIGPQTVPENHQDSQTSSPLDSPESQRKDEPFDSVFRPENADRNSLRISQRLPTPTAEDQQARESDVAAHYVVRHQEALKVELLSQRQKALSELAIDLLALSRDNADDPTLQFILLSRARDIGANAGDADTTFAAIQVLENTFDLETIMMREKAVRTWSEMSMERSMRQKLARTVLEVAEYALRQGHPEAAQRLIQLAIEQGQRARDTEFVKTLVNRLRKAGVNVRTPQE